MIQPNKTTRFYAVMLIGGGLLGLFPVVTRGIPLSLQSSFLVSLPAFALLALFAWTAVTGLRLWQGASHGKKWALVLFASQIPVLIVPGLTYEWFTGAHIGPALQFGGGATRMLIGLDFGASARFYVATGTANFTIGVNLFAAIALLLLLRANKAPQAQAAPAAVPLGELRHDSSEGAS